MGVSDPDYPLTGLAALVLEDRVPRHLQTPRDELVITRSGASLLATVEKRLVWRVATTRYASAFGTWRWAVELYDAGGFGTTVFIGNGSVMAQRRRVFARALEDRAWREAALALAALDPTGRAVVAWLDEQFP